jgi:glycosyltransferase involved in cell wall biosynthesis
MLESLASQEMQDFEHIVIDGGSTDETLEILKAFEGRYNLRWVSEPDRGMYNAINKGLAMATGEIIGYINTDDAYFPWTLRVVRDVMSEADGPSIVYGDVAFFEEATGAGSVLIFPEIDEVLLRRAVTIPQPATFWRRNVLDTVGFFREDLRAAGDLDYWLRVVKKARLTKIDEVLAADSRRPDALRKQFMAEYSALRREGYPETGIAEARIFLSQALRYYATGQNRLLQFTMNAFVRKFGGVQKHRWQNFLSAYGDELRFGPLVLANIPTRRRLQGLGLLHRDPIAA